jgi:hypothetical protein
MANPDGRSPDTCPGCAARIPATRPRFCEYCGATLPGALQAASSDAVAEMARRLADLQRSERTVAPGAGSWGMLLVTIVVVAFVLVLGCCAFLGVRVAPPH